MIQKPSIKKLRPKLETAFEFSQMQVKNLISNSPDFFPMYTVKGKWKHDGESWTNWCEGFLGGMMWIFYKNTGNSWWEEKAKHYSLLIEERKHDRDVHDLGFLFWSTWKRWYDLTGDKSVKETVLTAGKTLGKRFKEKGQYLRSFVAEESLFIDIMMNVGIIYYAAIETGDQKLLEKVNQHCLTTRRYLIRGDGSTSHEGLFNLETGEFIRQSTHQGWRDDSSWARGQGWAIYGFGTAYSFSKDERFLDAAQTCADFYLERTSFAEDAIYGPGVPPNDWEEPVETAIAESSAAAITASGLLNLAKLIDNDEKSSQYISAALVILDTLTSPKYLAIHTDGWEGILKEGIYHQRKGLGVSESVMWGEHFFVEALAKALELEDE
ncbi:MAG: glycosyl hydrolase [Chloroflexi bacterium]|jgi:unsaturated chondroitin disaccharide hydrolase|nr:glycosyl hydrolase [Chloroflexota bacterium]MBT4682273.1 glycosyl hydrolase [Chloroflexota bacterium]MBT4754783.1 glycosyl hydrolase [Chloroflexota bacterium]MBT5337041.1 glycosyl hydrolase [Chloroflexota bacterium]MBT6358783.1 glycosyl hydrolase [Chloroflexota bacterium]